MASLEPKSSAPTSSQSTLLEPEVRPRLAFLPLWISASLQSPRAWKIFLRCWVAALGSFILMLPNASLHTIGATAFMALLSGFLLPPYLPVQLTIFLLSTLAVGLLTGWGIGIGAMRAANAPESDFLIEANPVFQANPALAKTTAVFAGQFLDVRSTAVYGGFLVIGTFLFGLMRAYAPKLVFMSIFGTIAVDIFCTLGPLFPAKNYTLLNSLAISVGCYMALAALATFLVFPETMSHSALDTAEQQLGRILSLIQMQADVLGAADAKELSADARLIKKFRDVRALVIGTQQQLVATSGFLALEFTWGKWNGDDVRSLEGPMITLITRVGCLLNFDRLVGTARLSTPSQNDLTVEGPTRAHDSPLLRLIHTRNAALEKAHGVRPEDVLPGLDRATRELRAASIAGLRAAQHTIANVNGCRWLRT
ncbi:hypothetical protein C8J57DRAFT_1572433 [Mycena rebaudengoi]|nr:hypothetical protein C8J57DRAFT_1572433 [Mycena rebaudengoi]